jgi:hypothetical protein
MPLFHDAFLLDFESKWWGWVGMSIEKFNPPAKMKPHYLNKSSPGWKILY